MKTQYWILAVSIVVVLALFVAYGQSGFSTATAKSSAPSVGMADFLKIEYPPKSAGMGDLRIFEFSQNARVGFGDLQKLEADQIRSSVVGMGDLQLLEAGR